MRAVIQRVLHSQVQIEEKVHSQIKEGLLVLLGIEEDDNQEDIDWLVGKILKMRIFDDANGVMNVSVTDIEGEIMVISQFTLHASVKKGTRPSYIKAAKPQIAEPIYQAFIEKLQIEFGKQIKTGIFGADMQISLCNNGPVTIWVDTKQK